MHHRYKLTTSYTSSLKQLIKQVMPFVFGFGLVLTTVLLLMPAYTVPKSFDFYDKAQHSLVFVTLALAGLTAFSNSLTAVSLGLCVYGGLMEVCQSQLTTTRHGDVVDWLADSLGIAVGLAVYLMGQKLIKLNSNKIAV
jgi:VanZ family protein